MENTVYWILFAEIHKAYQQKKKIHLFDFVQCNALILPLSHIVTV